MMADQMQFASRADFRHWLQENCLTSGGIWLIFGKASGPKTLSANDALEEALCFGWIDGQIKSIDDKTYIKYFAQRRAESDWSAKNYALVALLEEQGKMTDHGRGKIEQSKQNGTFQPKERAKITLEQVEAFTQLFQDVQPAYANFLRMSASVQNTYTAHYLSAKSEQAREKRLRQIVDRLSQGLKPM